MQHLVATLPLEIMSNIGGLAAIHQRVRIGAYAMISGTAGVNEDVIPFGTVMAMRGKLGGLKYYWNETSWI